MLASATQIVGALLVLSAYLLAQIGKVGPKAWTYLILNTLGSSMLAFLALEGRQWGFLMLEGAWAVASIIAVVQRVITAQRHRDIGDTQHAPR